MATTPRSAPVNGNVPDCVAAGTVDDFGVVDDFATADFTLRVGFAEFDAYAVSTVDSPASAA